MVFYPEPVPSWSSRQHIKFSHHTSSWCDAIRVPYVSNVKEKKRKRKTFRLLLSHWGVRIQSLLRNSGLPVSHLDMASAIIAAPIRQPRGPSSNSFGSDSSLSSGPPAPDSESLIRRHNTISNPRHQPSASISSTPAASSAFHGARFRAGGPGFYRLRSGSLSSGSESGSLGKKVSGRLVRTEDVVIESGEEGTVETGGEWGKGLSRQSSLPSRRGRWISFQIPPKCLLA